MVTSKPDCLIVLIHGTYAADAKWPHEDSNFCKWLGTSLKEQGAGTIVFAQSPWSGGNSDLDRLEASIDLRARLAAFRLSHPDYVTFLVGHSHGGNVALHALSHSQEDRDQVAGVVTLATPFLLYDEEPVLIARLASALFALRAIALALAAIATVALIVYPLLLWLLPSLFRIRIAIMHMGMSWRMWLCTLGWSEGSCRSFMDGTFLTFAIIFGSILPVGMIGATWAEIRDDAARNEVEIRQSVERFYYVQPPERLAQVPILILWSVIDEALQVLNCSWWAHRAALWAVRFSMFMALAAAVAAIYAGLWWLYSAFNLEMAKPLPSTAVVVMNSLFALVMLPLIYALAALVGWFFRAVVRLPVPLHGSRSSLDNLLWTIRASRIPFAGPNVRRKRYSPLALLRDAPGLVHSTLYGSQAASPDIATWMMEMARSRRLEAERSR